MAKRALTYADAGVDIDEAGRATERFKRYARATFDGNVLTGIGAFGAAYSTAGKRLRDPVLVSSADGVGTKLNVAFAMDKHDTVGRCLVNHCVNDIAVQGAEPLFFLDYFATGKLEARAAASVVKGIAAACKQNGVALIGGETAEMPGMYAAGEYDLAGFIVGACERSALIDGSKVREGSVLIGLPSSGLHTNGYSLARKLFFDAAGYKIDTRVPELRTTVGKELLKVHRSYLPALRALAEAGLLLGAAHVTGGGITGNTPRMLPKRFEAHIRQGRHGRSGCRCPQYLQRILLERRRSRPQSLSGLRVCGMWVGGGLVVGQPLGGHGSTCCFVFMRLRMIIAAAGKGGPFRTANGPNGKRD